MEFVLFNTFCNHLIGNWDVLKHTQQNQVCNSAFCLQNTNPPEWQTFAKPERLLQAYRTLARAYSLIIINSQDAVTAINRVTNRMVGTTSLSCLLFESSVVQRSCRYTDEDVEIIRENTLAFDFKYKPISSNDQVRHFAWEILTSKSASLQPQRTLPTIMKSEIERLGALKDRVSESALPSSHQIVASQDARNKMRDDRFAHKLIKVLPTVQKSECFQNAVRSIQNDALMNDAETRGNVMKIAYNPEFCTELTDKMGKQCETNPKFSASDNTRFNKIFFAGMRNTVSNAWWFKNAINFDAFTDKDKLITDTLVAAYIPTSYIARVNVYAGLIYRLLHDCKSNRMRNVLFDHFWITQSGTDDPIIPVPDTLIEHRANHDKDLAYELFDEALPIPNLGFYDKLLILITNRFLNEGIVETKLIGKPFNRKIKSRISWPWTLSDDFNSLEKGTRNLIAAKGPRENLKTQIHKIHPHQYQSVECDKRCASKTATLLLRALDLRLRLNDTINTIQAKKKLLVKKL